MPSYDLSECSQCHEFGTFYETQDVCQVGVIRRKNVPEKKTKKDMDVPTQTGK
jgi:hypothetical protein